MATARQLAEKGFKIFRAGVWKPRTKPGGFEGMGETALPWLQRVKEETGMLIATEVAMPKHVEASLKAGVDLLWVGARTTANPFAMQELADSLKGVDIPVLVKNPVNPDIELWIGALQRINGAGGARGGGREAPGSRLFHYVFDDGELRNFIPQTGTHQQAVGEVNSRRFVQIGRGAEQTYYFFPTAVGYIDRRGVFIPPCIILFDFSFDIVNQLEDGIVDTYFLTLSLNLIV